MEFAVIETGGKQYLVRPGDILEVEKLSEVAEGVSGDKLTFGKVLLVDSGTETTVGTPYIDGAKVLASLVENGRSKKITVIKYKPKVRYRIKNGHRQYYTKVKIEKIV